MLISEITTPQCSYKDGNPPRVRDSTWEVLVFALTTIVLNGDISSKSC